MIQDISPHNFYNQFIQKKPVPDAYILLFYGNKSVFLTEEHLFPTLKQLSLLRSDPHLTARCTYLFAVDTKEFYLYTGDPHIFPGLSEFSLQIFRTMDPDWMGFAGMTAHHLYAWMQGNRYCGYCGHSMIDKQDERARLCPSCGYISYPKIAPAIIVGILDEDRILMTRYAGREYKSYALVAGFVEIGETPEDTVRREVMEEVGLRVKDLSYYKSQPWGFSGSLLLGYFAHLDGDPSINLDRNELSEASWFSRTEIPADLDTVSLTNEMIAYFRDGKI